MPVIEDTLLNVVTEHKLPGIGMKIRLHVHPVRDGIAGQMVVEEGNRHN
jgi:RNase P/RNase MRP subunit p29